MKPETRKMLNEWASKPIALQELNISVSKEYSATGENPQTQQIELMWFIYYSKDEVEKVLTFSRRKLPDDIDTLNIEIDSVEQNILINLIKSIK